MADLIGTARIRVDMPTAGATRQIRQFAARTEAQLRGVQRRITATTRDLRAMRGTSIDITLNDRTARGIAATRASVRSLQRLSPVTITTRLDDRTRRGVTTARASVTALQRLGPVRIPVTIDDRSTRSTTARSTITALQALGPVRIGVHIHDGTRPGARAVRTAVAALQRLGPVRIPVDIADGTSRGARTARATVAGLQRLGPVRINADVDVDAAAATAAAAALRDLHAAARGTGRALGTLATRATTATAALVALGAAARTLRGTMDDLDGSIRRTGAGMTGLRGRLGTITTSASSAGSAIDKLKTAALLLSPALVPIAAQAIHILPLAAAFGAATVAVGAFGAAVAGQVVAIAGVAEAEKKAADAAKTHGAGSKEAAKAQDAYAQALAELPPATRTAARAFSVLSDEYEDWSKALAADTMPVVTKSFAVLGATLPTLTPVVKGASAEMDRFMTILAGGVRSPGFDRIMDRFATFSSGVLKRANDGLIRFMRTLDTGKAGGAFAQVMEYAREHGPLVRDTLSNIGQALGNLLEAAANVGPGLLTVVNALAGIVAAMPPGAITVMLQLALAIKAVGLASSAIAVVGPRMAAFAAAVGAMRTAAAGATGVLPRLAAAFGALSRAAKVAVAGTGIGLLVIALTELAQMGRQAPPDVDKLTSSLARLGKNGKVAGEAARAFGSDLGDLHSKVSALTDPSTAESIQQWVVSLGGLADWDSTPVKDAKDNLNSIDEALAGLVKNGQADLAAAALKRLTAEYGKGGRDTAEFTKNLDDYEAALEDAKFEQQLAADAMGLFGEQAQKTSAKLAEQKASADGLRQAIVALNDVNRAGLGAMNAFEQAVDDTAKAARENAGALSYSGGELDLNSQKARDAEAALRDLAAKTDEAAGAARDQGKSWESVNGIYKRGRDELIKNAMQMGLTREEAKRLASEILNVPSKKSMTLEMRTDDAIAGLDSVIAAIKRTPTAKSVTVKALTKDAVSMLQELGFKVTRLKDGRFKVTADTKNAKDRVADVQRARDRLSNKTITLSARDRASAQARAIKRMIDSLRSKTVTLTTIRKTIAVYNTSGRPGQGEGGVSKYAGGGTPEAGEMAMVGERGPELVVFGQAARVFDAQTTKRMMSGTVGAGVDAARGLAAGLGASGGVYTAARQLADAVTAGVRDELQIASPSKKMRALAKDVGKGFISGLTGSRDKIKSVSKDLAKDVRAAFSGRRESSLIKLINRDTSRLLSLASKRDSVAKKIADAQKFATDTANRARATGSLGTIVSDDHFSPRYVEGRMKASLNAIKAFTSNVQKLQKRGLNKTLLRQILEMGPEEGAAFAKSLAGADAATIKRYNKLQSSISSASSKLGKAGADMLYDSGKNASKGFLTGLKTQQKDIEKLMLSIAKGMQKAIKKALGIRSPSTVFAQIGRNIGDGLVAGLSAASPAVAKAAQKISAVATQAATASAGKAKPAKAAAPKTGFSAAVAELQKLVDTGQWKKKGSLLFEDVSFQGMSKNFAAQQMKIADGFWAAVDEIKRAVRSGKKVFEDMTFQGMSANVARFHDMIAQIWKGNPYGRNFGDWGNFGQYKQYGKYASGGLVRGPGSGTADRVPILASNREYIINARATAQNLPLLHAINSGRVTTTGARTGSASAASGDLHVTLVVQNQGVIGSQMQMQDWLAKSLDNLARTGRLPSALRKAVA
ncbi:MAG UNVERIFIED_CONTAM: hypothetical protein LOD86_02215 [Thermobifida fusca]